MMKPEGISLRLNIRRFWAECGRISKGKPNWIEQYPSSDCCIFAASKQNPHANLAYKTKPLQNKRKNIPNNTILALNNKGR